MTALTKAKDRPQKVSGIDQTTSVPMYTQKIWAGALVMVDSSGYGRNALAGASNKGVAGVAIETVDNSGGSSGDKSIKVRSGRFLMTGTGFTQASVGSHIYASDNDTVSTTQGTNEPLVGTVEAYVSSTTVWAQIGPTALIAAG